MKKFIVTGSSGFVGMNLKKYLLETNPVSEFIPVSRNELNKSQFNFNGENICVVHLAGKAHDLKNISNEAEYFNVNTKLTKQVFDSFLHSTAEVFIFMSSVKACADKVEKVLTEEIFCTPETAYGKSKMEAENYILSKSIPQGKRVYILRPCMIHGPGNKGNLNLLYKVVSKGLPWPLGAFDNCRSFCSIENICFVIKELSVNVDVPNGIYQIADDQPLSTNELISLISEVINKSGRVINIPRSIIKSFARIGDAIKLPLNSERLQKLTENYIVSNLKIVKALNQPLPISTKNGLVKTIKSFQ